MRRGPHSAPGAAVWCGGTEASNAHLSTLRENGRDGSESPVGIRGLLHDIPATFSRSACVYFRWARTTFFGRPPVQFSVATAWESLCSITAWKPSLLSSDCKPVRLPDIGRHSEPDEFVRASTALPARSLREAAEGIFPARRYRPRYNRLIPPPDTTSPKSRARSSAVIGLPRNHGAADLGHRISNRAMRIARRHRARARPRASRAR